MVPLLRAAGGTAREGRCASRSSSGTQHWKADGRSGLRCRLADGVLSVSSGSFPLSDAEAARDRARDRRRPLHAVGAMPAGGRAAALARPRQDGALERAYDTMLEALAVATERGLDAQLEIRGPHLTEDERRTALSCEAIVRRVGRSARPCRIEAAARAGRDSGSCCELPMASAQRDPAARRARRWTRWCTRPAACGVPVIASNTALDEFLAGLPVELRVQGRATRRARGHSACVRCRRTERRRRDAGAELRRRVVAGHSVESWADAVTKIVAAQTRE